MKLDSFTMAEKNKDMEYFTPGTQVKVVFFNKTERFGEVISFDHVSRALMLKIPSTEHHGQHHMAMIHMDFVSHLEQKESPERQPLPEPLPFVSGARANVRLRQNIADTKRQRMYVGHNVSAEGQLLMDSISKTIYDVKWDKEAIVVMESVIITPPYTLNELRLFSGKETSQTQNTLKHVRKMVDKHHQDEKSRLVQCQNDIRRSTSASPAPSSSSTSSAS